MPDDIERLLHRRSDLSTFLVHLSRDIPGGPTARENVLAMLQSRSIQARSVFGMAKSWATADPAVEATQRCVCFTETPLEQVWMMTREINLRQVHLQPYGLAFTKRYGRQSGANPVWYMDITPGHDWLTPPVDVLVELGRRGESRTLDSPAGDVTGAVVVGPAPGDNPILKLTPFIEQMGPTQGGQSKKEFWWEREWRKVGNFSFLSWNWSKLVAAFAPEADHERFWSELATAEEAGLDNIRRWVPLLDPEWGLERMIARLAGLPDDQAGPFT
jgi:hypothetical protein